MKKQFLTTCAIAAISLLTANDSYGQWSTVNANDIETDPTVPVNNVYIQNNLGLGIPTATPPQYKLTVNGYMGFETSTGIERAIFGNTADQCLNIFGNTASSNGAVIQLFGEYSAKSGQINFVSSVPNGNFGTLGWDFQTHDNGNWNSVLRLFNDGTLTPTGHLHFEENTTGERNIMSRTPFHNLNLFGNSSSSDGALIQLFGENSAKSGQINFVSSVPNGNFNTLGWDFQTHDNGNWASVMKIQNDGQVVIGDVPAVNATDYKLYVQTGILTEKVKVAIKNTTNWSDFVFEENYELRSLSEVEGFIKQNKHLPEIPSAEEVVEEGIDMATMDAKLLQKIEELTLYIIQQQKEIDELKKNLNK